MAKVEFTTKSGEVVSFRTKPKSRSRSKSRRRLHPAVRRMAALVKKHGGDFKAASREYHNGPKKSKSRAKKSKSRSKSKSRKMTKAQCGSRKRTWSRGHQRKLASGKKTKVSGHCRSKSRSRKH